MVTTYDVPPKVVPLPYDWADEGWPEFVAWMDQLFLLGIVTHQVKEDGGAFRGWADEEYQNKFLCGPYLLAVLKSRKGQGLLTEAQFFLWRQRVQGGMDRVARQMGYVYKPGKKKLKKKAATRRNRAWKEARLTRKQSQQVEQAKSEGHSSWSPGQPLPGRV